MLIDLFPRAHARFLALPLLGPLLDQLARWHANRGFNESQIRARVRKAPALEAVLVEHGLNDLGQVPKPCLLELTVRKSQDDRYLSALVHSLADFLEDRGMLAASAPTPSERLADAYREHLGQVRGLATSTQAEYRRVALKLLDFLGFDHDPAVLTTLDGPQLDAFVRSLAKGCGLSKLKNRASFLRSFLRFLVGRGDIVAGLDQSFDSPRAPTPECPLRALPWETVLAFLAGISRDTAKGRRDYAMFLLIATYGLRSSEIAALLLDDISWRSAQFRIQRPKVLAPITLPLTEEAGAALADYLRHARPQSTHRAVFLTLRQPTRPLSTRGIQSVFSRRIAAGDLSIEGRVGPHSLRHSLALRLLRQHASVKVIGDLLGHRSVASTGVYLRVHEEHLRMVALDLPASQGGQA